ncbi:ATP-binding protein [Agromyces ramosus]|uniref:DNA-binding CsgD family transcriptional regulator/tetratricopeptide (TPR) repeat protein n=1 Tax=Agromyces ramosus TaxID=33879 RepID=A0ABU0R5X0_9MICO|nr:LuxR family transcriptional regulator [Agromyces ramosus]MDQ0893480.1 DNA-binding CsgD family transcriptional regulator/tetratricopeptide (TPR) repeat protein [Agromyces ramosus]
MREWSAPALPAGWTTSGQPPFIARHEEVAALESAWADAVGGAGRAVFVSGEPGSGKSRLVSEVCIRLRESGAAVLAGSCIQELGTPFEPFDEPLRVLLPAYRAQAVNPSDVESGELLERVLERTGQDAADRSMGQERVFAAVIDVLRAAAMSRPLVLALDDLHWAGPAAIQLLSRVVEGAADAKVLLLGTLRNAPPDRSDALADTLASLSRLRGVLRLDLDPFTVEEITDYVAIRAGLSRAGARESAELLRELTGGNPFLLRAMWRPVVEAERQGDQRVIELPDSVSDIVRSRIATLDLAQRSVLGLAAVLGEEVDLGEVIGISATSVEVTLEAMDAAVRTRLIEPPRVPGDRYRFAHAIARQAVIDLMPGTDVLRTHARIAQVLEAEFPAAPRLIQRLAHHYSAARALGFGDRAVTYLVRAAQLAQDRVAYEDAGRLFERASEITPDADERAELLLRSAASWHMAADTPQARRLYERVTVESGNPRLRVRAAIGYEDASWRPGLPGHRALELLSRALASVPPDETDSLYIEALGSVARATAFTGAIDEAELIGDRAVELARTRDDPHVLIAVLRSTSSMTLRPSSVAKRQDRVRELLPLVRPTGTEWIGAAAVQFGGNAYLLGDRAGMDQAERDCVELGRRWSRHHWDYWVGCVRFLRALIAGRLDDAATACQNVQRHESSFRSDATASATALQSYMVRRESGRVERVRPLISGTESAAEHWAPGLLAIYTELGLSEPASRTLDWMLEQVGPDAGNSSDWPGRLAFMTEAAIWLEDVRAAERLHPWLSDYTGLNLMSGLFVAPFGPADLYLGRLESLLGIGSPGVRFERALELAERSDAALHFARTLGATAEHLRRTDPSSEEASAFAARARAIAEPAGMVKVLRELDVGTAASAPEAAGGLTARECEVIALIAQGRSNRDIAAQLVISEHTAANHVRNILTKIGAVNRTQAAMFARERGLT